MYRLALLLLFCTSTLLAQQGKLSFDKTLHNFGTIGNEKKVQHTFTFTNNTAEPITIAEVESSCGCTATDWTPTPVAPGKEGYVVIEFDPHRKQGKFINSITIKPNKPDQAKYQLFISGNVTDSKDALNKPSTNKNQVKAEFIHYFSYNDKQLVPEEKGFQEFIDKIASESNGKKIHISIESSASQVPTELFKKNESLAAYRAEEARKKVIAALEKKGIKRAQLEFETDTILVQGPAYKQDFENIKIYEQYQYVKISVY